MKTKKHKSWTWILILIIFIVGCNDPIQICENHPGTCDCGDGWRDSGKVRIDELPNNKCNCCWETSVLNDKGYYEINTTCKGANMTEGEFSCRDYIPCNPLDLIRGNTAHCDDSMI